MKLGRFEFSRGAAWLAFALIFAFGAAAQPAPKPRQKSASRSAKSKRARPPKPAKLVSLNVFPETISLTHAEDQQQLLITGSYSDGSMRDLTREAVYQLKKKAKALIAVSTTGVITPVADGEAKFRVKVGGKKAVVVATVADASKIPDSKLVTDVLPVFSKLGCNSGACHGAAGGQNGFKLSMRGYHPPLDYEQMVKEKDGGRINKENPEKSLLLTKALGAVPHAGGKRFEPDGLAYKIVRRWIAAGAPEPDTKLRVVRIVVTPAERVVPKPELSQQLVVTAHYNDGTRRDVTRWARYSSNNDGVATVDDETGIVAAIHGGAAAIMVSYRGKVEAARIIVPVQERTELDYAKLPRANFIDGHVIRKWEQLKLEPSGGATDEEFLRRVYLDVIGTLPTPDETTQFLADKSSDRRSTLIDSLLERPEYAQYRALRLSDILRVNSQYLSQEGADTFYRWISKQTRDNVPYDQMVRELLTSRGSNFHVGPANYYRIANDSTKMTESTAQTFLGIRLNCAKCHNHPFEKWTQGDYYSFSAFFSRVSRKGGPKFGENQIYLKTTGEAKHPKTGETLKPKPLGAELPALDDQQDRRIALAEWMTSPANKQFAQVAANRVWGDLFGQGIVNEVDDFRTSNPPSNPALLEALGQKFIELNYDVKAITRLILNSRTYQLSSVMNETNAEDAAHFARALPKRMPAEVLADALDAVTGSQTRYGQLPRGTRAIQLPDSRISSYLLQVFGRPKREIVCSCERDPQPNLSQMLNLVNSGDLNSRIGSSSGRIAKAIEAKKSDEEIVRELYLATLSRQPRPEELELARQHISGTEVRKAAFEDLMWALINSQEFIFNH